MSDKTKSLPLNRKRHRGAKVKPFQKLTEELVAMRAPCFYHAKCKGIAEVSKCGRGVCRACAQEMPGVEFPLRLPIECAGSIGAVNRSLDMKYAFPSV